MFDKRLLAAAGAVLLMVFAAPPHARGEEEKKVLEVGRWYPSVESGINLTQSYYSTNWSGGDRGSIAWTFIANATLENQLDPKVNWLNTLKAAFGQTHQQEVDEDGDRRWDLPEKSTDQLSFETIARFTLGAFVDPFVAGYFETQFRDMSDPNDRPLSFNPLRFKESAGIARQFYKTENRELLSRVGFAVRQNSRRFFVAETGRETESETTSDGGLEWVTDQKMKLLSDRIAWTSKLTLNQPLFYSGQEDLDALRPDSLIAHGVDPDIADFPKTVDIDFENIFTNQISKLLSVNLYTRLVYDKYDNSVKPMPGLAGEPANPEALRMAVRKSGQFKQTLTVGVTYRFL